MKLLNIQLPHSPVAPSLSDPNIFLSTPQSNSLGRCSSLNLRPQISHPVIQQEQLHFVYFCSYFQVVNWKTNDSAANYCQLSVSSVALNYLIKATSICLRCFRIFKFCHTSERFITHFYVLTSSCIPLTRHEYTPKFLRIQSQPFSLPN